MKKLFCIVLLIIMILGNLIAQKHDFVWAFGYGGDYPGLDFEATFLDFKTSPPTSIPSSHSMWIRGTQASVCNKQGKLLAFTNGIYIADKNGNLMENGDSLNLGYYFEEFNNIGYPGINDAFFIPSSKDTNVYFLYHVAKELDPLPGKLLRTTLDFSYNQGLGKVVEKNKVISSGFFEFIGGTKHGNGRDWWILTRDESFYSKKFFKWLVTPDTVIGPLVQQIGTGTRNNGIGGIKSIFSKDGNTFIRPDRFEGIQVFDFDRCTGELSNPRLYKEPGLDTVRSINGEISPNGRFLYFNSNVTIYQLDLWADTLNNNALKTVAQYDGFIYEGKSTTFFMAQLGPDDKIYLSCTSIAPFLHVINNPDLLGLDCNIEQHSIRLAGYHAFSLPYFPNYRLSKDENSPCDTLSSNSNLSISYGESIRVYPNPAQTELYIDFGDLILRNAKFSLFDITGREIKKVDLENKFEAGSIQLHGINEGIYFYRIYSERGSLIKGGKLIIE